MKLIYKKSFQKQLTKFWISVKKKFDDKIAIFLNSKYDRRLNNHKLNGVLSKYRSINVTWDIRALYYEQWEEIVIFALIGSHSDLY
jgi:mRNA-degrading endonuclease YafQ of YafQ-DinJ toxin-antitoxin module